MKIYSMTATFGKLEHETLTLEPGLNVIHAPNEWGKTTWCAFLTAMLYGFESRVRSTQTTLSGKEHYTPWSGAPMSGSMDICWQGRNITIQRKTKGRAVFGDFRAFETESGLPVPELTAANCGQMLLGVERTVFVRSAFLRLSDLPVTQDEALRARLNALVTTGDDSGTAQLLEQKLKDLRNRCRYNRTGLLPQAEAEAAGLEARLQELEQLHTQAQNLRHRQEDLKRLAGDLDNHLAALAYSQSQRDAARVEALRQEVADRTTQLQELEAACHAAGTRDQLNAQLRKLDDLEAELDRLQKAREALEEPQAPETPEPFQDLAPEDAKAMVEDDLAQRRKLVKSWIGWLWLPTVLLLAAATVLFFWFPQYALYGGICLIPGLLLFVLWLLLLDRNNRRLHSLEWKYGDRDPREWIRLYNDWIDQRQAHHRAQKAYQEESTDLEDRIQVLEAGLRAHCASAGSDQCRARWNQALAQWDRYEDLAGDLEQQRRHLTELAQMVKQAPPPARPDALTYSEAETRRMRQDTSTQLQQLHSRLGQCQGRMEAVGHEPELEARLAECRARIQKLTRTYEALNLALTTLENARTGLQRKFAPKLTQRAQALMHRLTDGRYDKLRLAQDLSLEAATQNEDTLRPALWRSDGTMDQLYLALRLAVAGELTPEAPLVLDDALVRFDDQRLASAMAVLKEEAQNRQILLFTCHTRELQYL